MQQLRNWMKQIDEGDLFLHTEEYEDYRYQDANYIYEWLWELYISTDCDYDGNGADLETLANSGIIQMDLEHVALLTLYTDYQAQKPEKRAEDMYLYFSMSSFQNLHMQDIFHVGRESLCETERFWKDWIALLETKQGDMEARLLREAILYNEGAEGLMKMADINCESHPSLYLAAMMEYDKNHEYAQIEKVGEHALEKIDSSLMIRSEIALKAANASSCLSHTEKVMMFCWECFKADSTDKNYLRLFGTEKMAELYGKRGKEVLGSRIKGNQPEYTRNAELSRNIIGEYGYYTLSFYTGDFENEIIEESQKHKVSIFWNYFQRWKPYFLMEEAEQKKYLVWAEKIVYARADAIVDGQHRNHYREVAALLAIVGEIKESQGDSNAKREILSVYKGKFPRHSSFQAEMKELFSSLA